jgi:hypothetical protein
MKLRTLLFAVLTAATTAAQPVDLSESMTLVAKPELVDPLFGSTILVVTRPPWSMCEPVRTAPSECRSSASPGKG